ncbi:MAG: hypothetical protein CXT73_02065 [Methanobacteriota archaeon]|jgi:hypothetical protein|nr:MAG: hypothetical protein CXT73_02065 [Euryarchaeota archaeon]
MTLTTIQNELDYLVEENQSSFQLINTLTESRLFRQPQVLKNLGKQGLKDLTFLYILLLYILYNEPETHEKAVLYAKRTKSYRDFETFYIGGTDLYLLINANLGSINKPLLLMFLDRLANASIEREFVHRFFLNAQNTLQVNNSVLRSARRYVQDWHIMGQQRKYQTMTQILSFVRTKARYIEVYDDITEIHRKYS